MRFRRLFLLGVFVPFTLISAQTRLTSAPIGTADIRARIEAARDAAIAAGAQDILPVRLGLVDEEAASMQEKYTSGDYDASVAGTVLNRYVALKTILEAYNLKQEADDNRFISHDSANYDAGIRAGNNAMNFFDAASLDDAVKSAEDAVGSFSKVLNKGWAGYAEEQSGQAQSWRQSALDVRAHVAMRDIFQNADKTFNEAFASLRAEEHRDAAGLFDKAITLFRQSRDGAVEKRVRAEEAIRKAEQAVSRNEAAKTARETAKEE
ncbi:hypothetical protein FACS1894161_3090 [Spirochaetia bacterium]|nr:hypothetical protein FACS1894161_3090 [Spirochaetia bacterium]